MQSSGEKFIPLRPAAQSFPSRSLLGLRTYRPVAQRQPPPRALFSVGTRRVAGCRCELRFGWHGGFDRRAAILGIFRALLRGIGRIAGFVFEGESSGYAFEGFKIGNVCVKRLGFFCIFCIDSRSAGLKLSLDPVDIVSCKVPHDDSQLRSAVRFLHLTLVRLNQR